MSVAKSLNSVLIVEPNQNLVRPYSFLPPDSVVTRLTNTVAASEFLRQSSVDLVLLSCSFSSKKLLHFLEDLKLASSERIVPLILVVDLTKPYSIVPGLTWDKKLGLLSSNSTVRELELQLAHLA